MNSIMEGGLWFWYYFYNAGLFFYEQSFVFALAVFLIGRWLTFRGIRLTGREAFISKKWKRTYYGSGQYFDSDHSETRYSEIERESKSWTGWLLGVLLTLVGGLIFINGLFVLFFQFIWWVSH